MVCAPLWRACDEGGVRDERTRRVTSAYRGRGAERRSERTRDVPLPLLIVLAIGAVAAERIGRRGLLVVLPALLVCALAAGVGAQFAGWSAASPLTTIAARGSATASRTPPVGATVAGAASNPTVAPTAKPSIAPTEAIPMIPAHAGGSRTAAATIAPTGAAIVQPSATATARPSLAPTVAATARPTGAAPTIAPPTVVPSPPPATARDTTIIPILMYHYIRVVNDPKDQVGINLSVTPAAFAAQMQYLADRGYTTLTMREVHAILAGERPLPPKPIALTFDDGYRDFYTAAWPILQRHGFKATNYVVTNFIGWDAYMTWPMLQELDASGQIEIGAHTRSHGDLRSQKPERRWDEIAGSKAILEEGLGRPVTTFCYPAGFYNDAALADVKRARFLTAVTTQAGTKQNLQWAYALPRIRVNGPDPLGTWAGKLP